MYLTKQKFHSKWIKCRNEFIHNYDLKMITENKQSWRVSPNEKWPFYNSILLFNILNTSSRTTIWDMEHMKVYYVSKKTEMYQFQVGCMSFTTLKQNR